MKTSRDRRIGLNLTVLVLDDDDGVAASLGGIVEELGHRSLIASSAEEAFRLLDSTEVVHAVLADVRLPGLSGIEFLERVHQEWSDTQVILMTAHSDIDLAVVALETGAFAFLRKPFASKELEVMLRNIINTRRMEQTNSALRRLLQGMEVINSEGPLDDERIRHLLRVAIDTTRSDSGSIFLLNPGDSSVHLSLFEGLSDEGQERFRSEVSPSLLSLIGDGRAAVIVDESTGEENPLQSFMRQCHVTSALYAPLVRSRQKTSGVLILNRGEGAPVFDDSDRGLAEIFAHAMALAVENVRLREEQRMSSAHVQTMQRQLIQTEKLSSLGQLAAGIAHEINNPLTSVMGFAELLQRRVSDEGTRDFLEKIVTNAERIKRILLDLKDFYVPAKNRMTFLDVNRIIENAIPIARVHPEAAGVSFQKSLTVPLVDVHGDENQILQVLINMFINAFQSMPDGGTVFVSSAVDNGAVVVSVADTGCGIPHENLSRIFDPFFTTKSDWKGTGLGLSVCYTIVDNHGGRIDVESVVGQGSVFTMRLPSSAKKTGPDSEEPTSARESQRGRILVVDDESDCRVLLRTFLVELGFDVDEASCGMSAIEKVRSGEEYRLVFLDYKMPGMNGIETFRRLRVLEPGLKVIVLTGSIGQSARMVVELGAQGFVTKPFKMEEIEVQVHKVLGID